jgi:hypothetical protein
MVQLKSAMRDRARLLHAKKIEAILHSQTCKILLIFRKCQGLFPGASPQRAFLNL